MCFEVPAFVPPGVHANGNKNGYDDNDTNDDDISFIDSDGNDIKPSMFLSHSDQLGCILLIYISFLILSVNILFHNVFLTFILFR